MDEEPVLGTINVTESAVFYSDLLTDKAHERREYFRRFLSTARGCNLVFFDPDNGLEVKSKPVGGRDLNKYLYWPELTDGRRWVLSNRGDGR